MDVEPREQAEKLSPNQIHERFMVRLEDASLPFIPTPDLLYVYFRACVEQEVGEQYDIYASTSITSGGMVLPREDGETIPFLEGMKLNERFSVELMRAVIEHNPDIVSELMHVNPVFIGKVPLYHYEDYGLTKVVDRYYQQDDYLYYWFPVILGLEAPQREDGKDVEHWQRTYESMRTLLTVHRVLCEDDIVTMNERSLERDAKAEAYRHFTEVFFALVEHMVHTGELSMNPVKYILGLIDNRRSFGGNAEELLALLSGIPSLQPALASGDWRETPLAEIAEALMRRKATFAAPAGKVVLSLAGKLDGERTQVELTSEQRQMINDAPRDRRLALETDLRLQLENTVLGGDESERTAILGAMTELASAVSQDKRHLFHPAVIREVLRPGSVDIDDAFLATESPTLDERARQTILVMRDPYALSR